MGDLKVVRDGVVVTMKDMGDGTYREIISAELIGSLTNINIEGVTPIGGKLPVDTTVNVSSLTSSQTEIIGKAIDNILDTIGVENIKMFLPMWETSGAKAYDLLKKSISFSVNGATLAQDGPFGKCMSFDGVNDYLIRDPETENTAGATDLALDSGTKKAATRMAVIAINSGFVRLKLKRVGTLASATVKVSIYTDSSGPSALVTNGASVTLACSSIGTSAEMRGFNFVIAPGLRKDQKYWLVLEYDNTTGVDASNYIAWVYETGANTYGEARAAYDGASWTVTSSENHVFGIYNNLLSVEDDYTIIACFSKTSTSVAGKSVYGVAGVTASPVIGLQYSASGITILYGHDGTSRLVNLNSYLQNGFLVSAQTYSKADSTAKIKAYINGMLSGSVDGTATTTSVALAQPMIIGCRIAASGVNLEYFQGLIGPIIITKNILTPAQIAKVSHQLIAMRKFGGAV